MRYSLGIFTLLIFATSCSKTPPTPQPTVQQKTPAEPTAKTPTAEGPAELPVPPERSERLAVGEQAPDFRLTDQHGAERMLSELVADGKVALVFYRSANW